MKNGKTGRSDNVADYEFIIEVDNIDKIKQELVKTLPVIYEAWGIQGERNAKIEITKAVYDTPPSKSGYVRTGNLRNSLTHTRTEDAAIIGTAVEYAPYVEYGTSRMKPRPYLKPAVENHIDEYRQILMNYLTD